MDGEGALNGKMMERESPIQSPLNSIGLESVDQTLKQVAALGGKVVVPKTAITHMG